VKLKARGQATGQVPGVIQRSVSIFASEVDIEEAYEVGRKAVDIAINEGTGWMATILRRRKAGYEAYYDKADLVAVANSVRYLPRSWISADGLDVTDDFVAYAQPLIGQGWPEIRMEKGLQRFARFRIEFIGKKLAAYRPMMFRQA
jgi:6-phosphofructokinase 1